MTDKPYIIFPFDQRKALSVAEYLLHRLGGQTNYMYLLKLIFFADRYHLRKYLRPATSDRYIAMKKGVVASYLYDICKGNTKIDGISSLENFQIKLEKSANFGNELSPSDIEAIDFSLAHFAHFGEFALSEITHAYPEWKMYEQKIVSEETKSEQMFFEDFLLDADPNDPIFKKFGISDPYPTINDEERKAMESMLVEICTQTA